MYLMGIKVDSAIMGLLAILAILLIIFIVFKIIKGIITIAALLLIIPLAYTLFFGDGSALVHSVSEYLSPEIGSKIEESYDYFREKDQKNTYY